MIIFGREACVGYELQTRNLPISKYLPLLGRCDILTWKVFLHASKTGGKGVFRFKVDNTYRWGGRLGEFYVIVVLHVTGGAYTPPFASQSVRKLIKESHNIPRNI